MKEVINKAAELMEKNTPFAFVTIVQAEGSAPRHQAKTLVESSGEITGTIGGGPVEQRVMEEARRAIGSGKSQLFTYTLDQKKAEGINMLCGGDVTFFIETVGAAPEIVLVGAGHVGLAVSRMCDVLGYPYRVADERPDLEKNFPRALSFSSGTTISRALASTHIGSNSYICIFTSNSDEEALGEIIQKECPYIGMIGSSKKITAVFANLKAKGVSMEQLKRVHTPIGISINAETPEEIAVSVLGEIIARYRGR